MENKINLDTAPFLNYIGKDYLQVRLPPCKNHLLPIQGVQLSSASNNMYLLGILDTNLIFSHPAGSVGMKAEIVIIDSFTFTNNEAYLEWKYIF